VANAQPRYKGLVATAIRTDAPVASTATPSKSAVAPPPPSPATRNASAAILDRIDIHVEVPRVDYEELAGTHQVENSATILGLPLS